MFLINTYYTKGPCAGLFTGIIQLFYYLIKPSPTHAFINLYNRIYYMEIWQEDFTAIFYRSAGSSFQMHSQYPTFIIILVLYAEVQDIFTEFQSLVFYILLTTNIIKNLNNTTTNLH